MNNNHRPNDDLLQLVFGELDDSRQAAVRKKVAEDAELAATVCALTAAVAAVSAENVGLLSDEFNDRLRQRMPEILDPAQTETTRSPVFTLSLDNWRLIMRSPVSRVTAAAIFACAVVGTMVWFNGAGATPAFADVAQQILEMKSAKFQEISTNEYNEHFMKNYKGGTTVYLDPNPDPIRLRGGPTDAKTLIKWTRNPGQHEVLWSAPGQYRREYRKGERDHSIRIWDYTKQKRNFLSPSRKSAWVTEYPNRNEQGIIEEVCEILRKAKNNPEVESLGKKVIDGHNAVGYRLKEDGEDFGEFGRESVHMDIWADSKTLWPVRIEQISAYPSGMTSKTIMSKFEYNVKLDKSLFNDETPADYDILYQRKMSIKD